MRGKSKNSRGAKTPPPPAEPQIKSAPSIIHSTRLAGLLAAALAALLYVESLGFGYVYDDVTIVEADQRLRDPLYFLSIWWQPWWPEGSPKAESRPLTSLTFWAHMQLHGAEPIWPHAVNILIFAALTYGVSQLAAQWLQRPWAAWPVGLIFAAHPIHVEVVANLVGRAETLSAAFVVAALLAWHRWREAMSWPRGLTISLLVLLAGLSKETGYLSAPIVLLAEIAERRCEGRRIWGPPWLAPLVLGIAAVAILAVGQRSLVVAGDVQEHRIVHPMVNPLVASPLSERLVTPWMLVGKAGQLLLFPYRQATDYSPQMLMPTSRLGDPLVLMGVAVVVAWGFAVGRAWSQRWRALGPLLACSVAWVIPSNTVILIGTIFGERLLTLLSIFALLALVGLLPARDFVWKRGWTFYGTTCLLVTPAMVALLLAMLLFYSRDFAVVEDPLRYLMARYIKLAIAGTVVSGAAVILARRTGQRLQTMALAAIAAAHAATALCYMPVWYNWDVFTVLTATRDPSNGHFQGVYAVHLIDRAIEFPEHEEQLLQRASELAENAVLLWPTQSEPYVVFACVAKRRGDDEAAQNYYLNVLKSGHPTKKYATIFQHFGINDELAQSSQEIAQLRSRLKAQPNNRQLQRELASWLLKAQDPKLTEEAVNIYQHMVGPDISQVRDEALLDEIIAALLAHGDAERLIDALRHLLQVNPRRTDTRISLALTLLNEDGDRAEIRRLIDDVLRVRRDYHLAWYAKSRLLEKDGQLRGAIEATKTALRLAPKADPRRPRYQHRIDLLTRKLR